MLRQDSIHSADIRSKGSPFRAKCHEIFCCPLKQAVHKENAEPEGLFSPRPCFDLLLPQCPFSSCPIPPLTPSHHQPLSSVLCELIALSPPDSLIPAQFFFGGGGGNKCVCVYPNV